VPADLEPDAGGGAKATGELEFASFSGNSAPRPTSAFRTTSK